MAWQWSECVFRALKPSQCLHHLEPVAFPSRTASTKPSRLPSLTPIQITQRRLLSISSSSASSNAAPPINFAEPNARPARILPASPAYFSGTPKFIDHFLNLERLRSKYASLPTVPTTEAPRMAWLKLSQFTALSERLFRVQKEVETAMKQFIRPGNPYQQKPVPRMLDDIGRARGVGRRKTSTATVWLVEGDGQVMVNGKSIVHVFPRIHDRESALWALKSTDRMDKYNVWAMVHGGGVTGQAEAITLALAKALLIHEPALKPMLRRAGVITADPRQVERKKPGHRKARKKPAWVKR
ncbi:40S ribosomal protein S9 [Coccidioides immitis H538.4]|uniref:Small ribosomal subunit protein uS9m n=1 Tax=Coccidioides immitis H538.4 TaxID=396776 RepID=A0A0J8RX13_COCIT|nr:40S ribosomal protein S9 [Coccidioides immitis H538.4]